VPIVGKTNLTEFAVTVSGENSRFGTPRNRFDGKHEVIPGGSSSGSAVAVKTGMADVAFGTDTAGSIRVPAACFGVYGLKTTFGLVPIQGGGPFLPSIWTPSGDWQETSPIWYRAWTCCNVASRPAMPQHVRLEPVIHFCRIEKWA
jgi:hypothetical protein